MWRSVGVKSLLNGVGKLSGRPSIERCQLKRKTSGQKEKVNKLSNNITFLLGGDLYFAANFIIVISLNSWRTLQFPWHATLQIHQQQSWKETTHTKHSWSPKIVSIHIQVRWKVIHPDKRLLLSESPILVQYKEYFSLNIDNIWNWKFGSGAWREVEVSIRNCWQGHLTLGLDFDLVTVAKRAIGDLPIRAKMCAPKI